MNRIKSFVNDSLRAPNVVELPFDRETLRPLLKIYRKDILPNYHRKQGMIGERTRWHVCLPDWHSDSDLAWISPVSSETQRLCSELFDKLHFDKMLRPLVDCRERVVVYYTSIIVRSVVPEENWHTDYTRTKNNAFSIMVPLSGTTSRNMNLLYKDVKGRRRRYVYRPGRAIAFSDNFEHCTQPGRKRALTAFLCFTCGSDKMKYWPQTLSNIETQTSYLRDPRGRRSPDSQCQR